MSTLLEVKNLHVTISNYGGKVHAVRGISLHVQTNETLAIVGESGSGKSITARSILGLLPSPHGRIQEGKITFKGKNLVGLGKRHWRKLRGSEIGMVFQDPLSSLNPTMKIGNQIAEGLIKHRKLSSKAAQHTTLDLLRQVGIADAEKRISQYPHEFSGGMRQRVALAIALACEPSLLIADEPTTALDVTIQAQILELLVELQQQKNIAILLITHDLGVVAEVAHRVAVMYAGTIVETGNVAEVFNNPQHPYTQGLLRSIPSLDSSADIRLTPIEGTPPDLSAPASGCPFAPRCPYAMEICLTQLPNVTHASDTHSSRCWLHDPRASHNGVARHKELVSIGGEG